MNSIRVSARAALYASLAYVLLLPLGCDDGGGSKADDRLKGPGISQGVVGTVRFEKRTITDGLLSGADDVILVPARYVRLDIVEDRGGELRTISSTVTDGLGRFGIGGSFPDDFRVIAYPESPPANDPSLPVEVVDMVGNRYGVASPLQPAVADTELRTVNLTATVDTVDRVAGAFNIVDVVQRAALFWLRSTSIQPAASVFHWESGGFDQPLTSFFNPSTGELFILGGSGSLQDSTDTDEFDDTVVAHEYMHFLSANHSHSASPGGPHGREDLVPHLAFDEALADWFGALANSTSLYEDTSGNKDGLADTIYRDDLEDSSQRVVVGIGSEQSCYEILWDLTDGPSGFLDRDSDGVSISAAEFLQVVADFDPESDYPYLITLLDRLVGRNLVSVSALQGLLQSPVDHDITYPPEDREVPSSGRDVFPVPLAVGQRLLGYVDSVSPPPVGRPNEERGFDSIRYYRLDLGATTEVTITLDILDGDGTTPNDLDLYLLDLANVEIALSNSQTPQESISRRLRAGSYIVAVFSFYYTRNSSTAETNRGNYALEVSG